MLGLFTRAREIHVDAYFLWWERVWCCADWIAFQCQDLQRWTQTQKFHLSDVAHIVADDKTNILVNSITMCKCMYTVYVIYSFKQQSNSGPVLTPLSPESPAGLTYWQGWHPLCDWMLSTAPVTHQELISLVKVNSASGQIVPYCKSLSQFL